MKWLLIVTLLSPSGIPTPFLLEFPTEEACLSAKAIVQQQWDVNEYIESWCVLKPEEIVEG